MDNLEKNGILIQIWLNFVPQDSMNEISVGVGIHLTLNSWHLSSEQMMTILMG